MTPYRILPETGGINNVLVVDPAGYGDYTTIQGAIDYAQTQSPSAASRWLILIAPGIYDENLTPYDYIDLAGLAPEPESTVIRPASGQVIDGGEIFTMTNITFDGNDNPFINITSAGANITLINVRAENDELGDSAIAMSDGTLTIKNCHLESGGGVLELSGGTIKIYDSVLRLYSDSVSTTEPTILHSGGAALEIHRSTITNDCDQGSAIKITGATSPWALKCYHSVLRSAGGDDAIEATTAITGYVSNCTLNDAIDGNVSVENENDINAIY